MTAAVNQSQRFLKDYVGGGGYVMGLLYSKDYSIESRPKLVILDS